MQSYKILWADDDVDDLQLMREILARKYTNFSIDEVANGREALEYLHKAAKTKNLPSLIVLDINMPILDGKETLLRIRSTTGLEEIPLVVFTTSRSELDKSFCKKHQVQMITKPPTYDKLVVALDTLVSYVRTA